MDELVRRAQPWAVTLVQHNWPVILYLTVATAAAIWAYLRPTRYALLFLYGAICLIVAFEYDKHARAEAIDTVAYLFGALDPGVRAAAQWLLADAVPVSLRLIGLALLAGAVLLLVRQACRRRRPYRDLYSEL